MRSQIIEGIIIKRKNVGEADRILTIFTKELGKIQIKAKGIRRISSKRSSHVELLNFTRLTIHRTQNSITLTEAQHIQTFEAIKKDLKKIGIAYHLCELIDGLCPENQENARAFSLFREILKTLAYNKNVFASVKRFELELLDSLGYGSSMIVRDAHPSSYIEDILERKLKSRQILPRLL